MASDKYQEITLDQKNKIRISKIDSQSNKLKQLRQTILITEGKQVRNLMTKVIQMNKELVTLEWIQQHLKISKKLQGKQIPKIVRFFQEKSKLYIVMQKAQKSFDQLIHDKNKIGSIQKHSIYLLQSKILYYIKEIVNAVHQLIILYKTFNFEYIHCHIKPSNILLFQNQRVSISDHLAGKIRQEIKKAQDKSIKKNFSGVRRFSAPELLNKGLITPKVDVWSIGILILYMMGQFIFDRQISQIRHAALVNIQAAQKNIQSNLEELWNNEGSLKINKLKVNKQFWRQLLSGMLQIQYQKRWELTKVKDYIDKKYQRSMKEIEQNQYNNKPFLQITICNSNTSQIQNCWYDVHLFEYQLIQHIFTIYDIIDCDKRQIIHLSILLLLSILQYKNSFQNGIQQKKYKQKYVKQLWLMHGEILQSNNRKHFQQAKERVQYILQTTGSLVVQRFNQLKDLQKLCNQQNPPPLDYKDLMNQYILVFEDEIKICQLSQCYLILFKVVAAKKHLILWPNKLAPLIDKDKYKYQKIFKTILEIKQFLLTGQQNARKIQSKKKIKDFQSLQQSMKKINDFQLELNKLCHKQVQIQSNQLISQSGYQMN